MRKVKILATVGPASDSKQQLRRLVDAGVNIFRLNFSHGDHADHASRFRLIREIEAEVGHPIGVLMDLQGPKLRVGVFAGGKAELKQGDSFRFDLDIAEGNNQRVNLPHPEIIAASEVGQKMFVDDGLITLEVTEKGADFLECEIKVGGVISNRKGVNVPDAILDLSPLSEKDHEDLAFGLELGVDWVALSFVQRPQDIVEAKKIIQGRASIMAKIEKPSAVELIDEIIEEADGIMVARGDLGVELPVQRLPTIQKKIIRHCRDQGKPVVVATQMLESMRNAPAPTRAEASDVANAVYDGCDAVMLSAETASGTYPIEAVKVMSSIIDEIENDPSYVAQLDARHLPRNISVSDAVCASLREVAKIIPVSALVTYTSSGHTSLRAARERPKSAILSLSPSRKVCRMLTIVWGIYSEQVELYDSDSHVDVLIENAKSETKRLGFASSGEHIVVTMGLPLGQSGRTNMMRVVAIH